MKNEENEDWFPEDRPKIKALASEILDDINQTYGDPPDVPFSEQLEYHKEFLQKAIDEIDECDNVAFVFCACAIEFLCGDEMCLVGNKIRSDKAKKSAESSRQSFKKLHQEIRRIGESVRRTANEHEITPIVQHRLQKLGYTPTRRTIRTSLQNARIIRTQAERKKGK